MRIPFIKYSKVWYAITIVIIILSLTFIFKWGLKLGIDFTGGSLLEVSFSQSLPASDVFKQSIEQSAAIKEVTMQKSGELKYIVRSSFLNEDQHQKLIADLRAAYQKDGNTMREEHFETIGSAVSRQLRQRALWAIILVNLGIIIYVAYAFRKVSRPIASWKYGVCAIIAQLHDVLLVVGVFAALGHFNGLEVNIDFVVALLTVLGYSVTDTIVVYDRIRENLLRHSANAFSDIVNNGLNDTLMRSINTTLTVILPLLALLFLGGASIHSFVLALLIGMTSGAYSSIFIAGPLLVLTEKWQRRAA